MCMWPLFLNAPWLSVVVPSPMSGTDPPCPASTVPTNWLYASSGCGNGVLALRVFTLGSLMPLVLR
jgi:hypothetical protein